VQGQQLQPLQEKEAAAREMLQPLQAKVQLAEAAARLMKDALQLEAEIGEMRTSVLAEIHQHITLQQQQLTSAKQELLAVKQELQVTKTELANADQNAEAKVQAANLKQKARFDKMLKLMKEEVSPDASRAASPSQPEQSVPVNRCHVLQAPPGGAPPLHAAPPAGMLPTPPLAALAAFMRTAPAIAQPSVPAIAPPALDALASPGTFAQLSAPAFAFCSRL